MEVFMRDINFSLTPYQLTTRIAAILHGPGYAGFSPLPLNFHVYLFKDKRGGRNHSGIGALTLPTVEVALQFLAEYGEERSSLAFPQRQIWSGPRRIKFSESKRKARPEVVESITRLPYIDPKAKEEREQRVSLFESQTVQINAVQFGWECRDLVFSIEWELDVQNQCSLSFDEDRRDLRIKIIGSPSGTYIIALRFSHIRWLSVHTYLSEQPIIYFTLLTPPSFELETITGQLRQRLSSLPFADHERVVPYTSLAMRLVCHSENDLNKFLHLCRAAKVHGVHDTHCPIERRQLFASEAIDALQLCLRRFNWCVSFQIEAIVRSMAVDVREMLSLMGDIQRIVRKEGKKYTASLLRAFGARAKLLDSDTDDRQEQTIEQCFKQVETNFATQWKAPSVQPTDGSLFESFHVVITPTTMFLDGPFPERSNRVIRMYSPNHHESFLRVSFVDEARLQYRFDRDVDGPAFIRSRVGEILLNGLTISRRIFHFLAYSQSALKEHAVWFVKPFRDQQRGYVDAPTIIKGLGSFQNLSFDPRLAFCPARYAARLSQAFTATDASVSVSEVEEIIILPDIESEGGKYCFTDGVGTISGRLAREIWTKLKATRKRARRMKAPPRAFQVRLMGSKGMLTVDYKLEGRTVCLRNSMIKFEAPESREIEIARAFDRPGRYFLNRPLIMLLEGLGVPYEVFQGYQDLAVRETEQSTESLALAAKMFESHGLGTSFRLTSVLRGLEKLGVFNLPNDSFYQRVLEYAVNHILRVLKNHARIPVPHAWTLVGVADVHKFLQPGEIFACIKPVDGSVIYLEGPVLISRSPTIHPGDVQVVNAIGTPPVGSCFAREPLANAVVFSVLGDRPLPSCLGGGDLDGDEYNLIPLTKIPRFRPTIQYPAAEYEPAPKKYVDHPATMTDVAEFVMEYINSDVVGIVAINWLIIADQSLEEGIFHPHCLKLSALHSDAVDYPKSGQPVAVEKIPKLLLRERPDWNAPETVNLDSANYYESQRAIGRLFREINLPAIQTAKRKSRSQRRGFASSREETVDDLVDSLNDLQFSDDRDDPVLLAVENRVLQFLRNDLTHTPEKVEYMSQMFSRYASELQTICASHTLSHARGALLTEEEAMVGTIVQRTSQPRKRKDVMAKLREQTDVLVRGIREELAGDDEIPLEESLEKAWLAWEISITKREEFGGQSFGWVALGAIFESIKDIEEAVMEEARSRGY